MKNILKFIFLPFIFIDYILYKFVIIKLKRQSKNWTPEVGELVFVDDNQNLKNGRIENIFKDYYDITIENRGIKIYPKNIVYRNNKYIKNENTR